jgi:hypothetical protein
MKVQSDALISPCGQYRYWLARQWDADKPRLGIIMLNPSTADASLDDPTIRRCVSFARREDFGGIQVMNLFAFRATSPDDMRAAANPVGPANDQWISAALRSSAASKRPILAAWGAHGDFRARANYVTGMARLHGATLVSLGTTKDGHPRHPLYVKGDQPFESFGQPQ